MTIRGKPNVEAFLDGGNEALDIATEHKHTPGSTEHLRRVRKLFELPESMVLDLEQKCIDERRRLGRRVTQTELVEYALRGYLYGNN